MSSRLLSLGSRSISLQRWKTEMMQRMKTDEHNQHTTNNAIVGIGVAGSFSGGGQPLRPAKIQFFPAKIFACQGGAKFLNSVLPS